MNPARLPLHSTLLIAALAVIGPLAAQTGFSSIATSGGSPLLNDPNAGEAGTIPAAPPAAVTEVFESASQAPAGFVGRSDAPQPDLNADPKAYRGLWEIQPNNAVTPPEVRGHGAAPMER